MGVEITSIVIKAESVGITQAAKALDGLAASAAVVEKGVTALSAAMTKLNTLNTSSAAAANSYMSKLREQAAIMQSLNASAKGAAGGTEALAAAMALLAASLNLINNRLQENVIRQRASNESMREAHALARGLAGSFNALWTTYGNFAGMAVGIAIGASLKGIVTIGKDVENTLEGIRVRGGETIESANKVRESIYKIGEGVYGPQEVAKAFESLALAGLKAKDSALAIGAALNLATAGGTSIEKAAEGLVSIGTAVGATAGNFDYLADGITAAANTSLASVDSITEAVKRASIVNKLYGASFDDILTQTAALAQLGIKNTAAGTAIANFYNNAVGNTNKSREALKALGMSFTDATGKAKPLVEAFEEFSAKLNKYDLKSQQNFINDIFGERALRDVEALRDAVNKSADDTTKYSNKLREIQGSIADAAGTASLQSVQLGLTTTKQMISVANTLKTSFTKAFDEVGPQILEISERLKELFKSPEFINGITNMAVGFANLVGFIADNTKALGYLVTGLVAYKVAMGVSAMIPFMTNVLLGSAAAFGATAVAANGAAVATGAFGLAIRALPGIGAVLSVITVAIGLLAVNTNDAKDSAELMATTYNNNYAKALEDEVKRLENINRLKREGRDDSEALAGAMKEEALARYELNSANAIGEASKRLDAARAEKNGVLGNIVMSTAKQIELNKARAEYNKLIEQRDKVRDNAASVVFESGIQKMSYNADQIVSDILGSFKSGVEIYDRKKEDKAGVNDSYAAAVEKINGRIKASKEDLAKFEEKQDNLFKTGQASRIEVIRSNGAKEVEELDKQAREIQSKINIAGSGKNKEADVARFRNEKEEALKASKAVSIRMSQEEGVELARIHDTINKNEIKEAIATGQFVKAAKLKFADEQGVAFMRAKKAAEDYGSEFPNLIKDYEQLKATSEAMLNEAGIKEAKADLDLLFQSMKNGIKGVQTANESGGMGEMMNAAIEASERYKNQLAEVEIRLIALKAASENGTPAAKKDYEEELIKQKNAAEQYKTMWAGVGESISKSLGSAFGNGGKALGSLITQFSKFDDLDKQTASQRVKSYGDMAGAAKGFFKEGSTGYKVLETAERAFRIVELAGMAQSLAATIANAAAKAAAYVPAVFMSFMASLGPWGMAAAGVAIASVLGGAFSGGGGAPMSAEERQKTQGTGSVLGDSSAKSESISRSLEAIQRDSGLGLVNSNSMVVSLKQIVSGIGGLGGVLNRGGLTGKVIDEASGGFFSKLGSSIFGGKTTTQDLGFTIDKTTVGGAQSGVNSSQYIDTKTSGGWFSSDKYKTQMSALGKVADDQFTMIIKGLADTITNAANTLGMGGTAFTEKLSSFVIDIGKISLKGLTGEEQQKALEAVFSKLGDEMAGFAVAGLADFRKVGEGYLETLVRVTNEVIQVNDVFAVLGKSFKATGMDAIKLSQDLISAAGDIETLTKNTKFFVDNFLSAAERIGPVTESLNKRLTELGVSTSLTEDEFKKLVLSQDLTTAGGQSMYAALVALAPAFKQSSDYAIELANGTVELTKAQQALLDISNKQRELDIELMRVKGDAAGALAAEREDELKALYKLSPALAKTQQLIYDVVDAASNITKLKSVASGSYAELTKSIDAARAASQDAYNTEIARIDSLKNSAKETYDANKASSDAARDAAKTLSQTLGSLLSALESTLNSMLEDAGLGMKREQGLSLITDALEVAKRTGVLPTADDLKLALAAVSKSDTNNFASFNDYIKEAGTSARTVADLADITGKQKTDAEKNIELLERNASAAEESYKLQSKAFDEAAAKAKAKLDADNKKFDTALAVAKDQLDVMNGTYVATLGMQDALNNFNANVLNAIRAQQNSGSIAPNGSPASGTASSGTPTVTDSAIKSLYKSILGREPDAAGLEYWSMQAKKGMSSLEIAKLMFSSAEYQGIDGSHASGLDDVPKDNYLAKLHRGEKVLTASDAKSYREDMSMKEVIQALNDMKEDNSAENQAMNSQLVLMRKIFQNITPNGTSLNVNTVVV